MKILVLGATGFLGAHVCYRAAAAGLRVRTAARSGLAGSTTHRRIDLAADGVAGVSALLADLAPDVVINCAGSIRGSAGELAAGNVTATANLIEAMLRADAALRLVHIGSAAEYGRTEPGVPVVETVAPQPVGPYGLAKLAGTRLVGLARAAGLDAVVLRVFNPIGPGAPESSLPGRVAAELWRASTYGTEVRLGPLDAVRDFVNVTDVADAALAAATASALPHPVLNVGSGVGTPVRALVKQLVRISGWTGDVHEDAVGSARSAEVPWQQADIALASQDIGWRPRRELAASLTGLWETTP